MSRFLFLFSLLLILGCDPDDETIPSALTISIESLSVDEGSENNTVGLKLSLNRAAEATVTARLSAKEGTAIAGEDYVDFENSEVVFATGESEKEFEIQLIGDLEVEPDEEFEVEISSVDGAEIARGTAKVTILNDEAISIPSGGTTSPESYPNMTLIWEEDFDGDAIDESRWNFEIGNGSQGWGNWELQYYLKENARLVDGHLVIEAKEQSIAGQNYTSTRMTTQNKFDFKYGRVDIRANLPSGQGIWPALWMLGANFSSVGWPRCGEIDIMEVVGNEPNKLHGTAHWWEDSNGSFANYGGDFSLAEGTLQEEFHVFSIVWSENRIDWYVDDIRYHGMGLNDTNLAEFQEKFFFVLNVAVGGNWPGSPDATTVFPQRMIVDYIRVFQPE